MKPSLKRMVVAVATVALVIAMGALPALAKPGGATITGTYSDACRDFSAQSSAPINFVTLHYADGRKVKDTNVSGSSYSRDGAEGDELATAAVKSSSTTTTFTCQPPPEAVLEVLSAGGGFAEFSASNSTGDLVSWSLDYGDGSSTGGGWVSSPPEYRSHAYGAGGNYLVTLSVTDDEGQSDEDSVVVNVGEAGIEPFAILEVLTPDEDPSGPPYFRGSNSLDPDGTLVSWTIDFGDGNSTGGDWATEPPEVVNHTYDAPGTYQVTLTVTDNSGQTGSTSEFVTV